MIDTTISYAAGLVDGEGSIMLCRNGTKYVPVVSVSNNDLNIINFLFSNFGGKIVTKKRYSPKHNINYEWKVLYNNALSFIELVYPHLRQKSKVRRSRLLIRFYKKLTNRNGKYTSAQAKIRDRFIQLVRSS